MNFISGQFVAFFLATLALFVGLPPRYRRPMLLVMSYLFYATWNIPFIALILLTTSVDYFISHYLHKTDAANKRKTALIAGITLNLLVLGYYKYANFLLDSGYGLIHWLGYTGAAPEALHIILPLGISFYTFEAISYMVDVYRGKEPARNWLDYNFYIMYFPHLISGPIIRFCELAPQFEKPLQLPSFERFHKATELMILGIAYKVLIADQVAGVADAVFGAPETATTLSAWIGALAFTVQIYFDFMGYTHIARGASLFFNIELPLNFNHPYIAENISNFWERWHISLSRWIRDYLYIPLGGSRCSLGRTAGNLFVTMLIAGAWHGAGWTYILWGGYHGLLLGVNHFWRALRPKIGVNESVLTSTPYRVTAMAVTFGLVVIGWVLFRATDMPNALAVYAHMGNLTALAAEIGKAVQTGHMSALMQLLTLLALCFSGPLLVRLREALFDPMPVVIKTATVSLLMILCWIFTSQAAPPFIYFQF